MKFYIFVLVILLPMTINGQNIDDALNFLNNGYYASAKIVLKRASASDKSRNGALYYYVKSEINLAKLELDNALTYLETARQKLNAGDGTRVNMMLLNSLETRIEQTKAFSRKHNFSRNFITIADNKKNFYKEDDVIIQKALNYLSNDYCGLAKKMLDKVNYKNNYLMESSYIAGFYFLYYYDIRNYRENAKKQALLTKLRYIMLPEVAKQKRKFISIEKIDRLLYIIEKEYSKKQEELLEEISQLRN